MPAMRAVRISRLGGPLELVELPIPDPGPGEVRIEVQACGICHSDTITQMGGYPGLEHPRIPGHEVVGRIDATGAGASRWRVGQRVGVGWNGGFCGHCDACRRGSFFACQTATQVTGLTRDGGYAEFMIAPVEALAAVPDELSAEEAAPLLCAGLTTFNALRNGGARPGDLVAVLGLGGLGHLAVQFAARMGFRTVAIARGQDKEPLARKLGAWRYVDSRAQDPAAELAQLGGAKLILSTVTSGEAMRAVLGGLGVEGTLMLLGIDESLTVSPGLLVQGKRAVKGWYSGTSIDAQDTLAFSVLAGVRSMNEAFPLDRAAEAYQRMQSGAARFRVVLVTGR